MILGLVGQCADDVIGLEAFDLNDGDAVGLEDALDVGHGNEDALRGLFAVGLVGLVVLVPEGVAAGRVKADGQM